MYNMVQWGPFDEVLYEYSIFYNYECSIRFLAMIVQESPNDCSIGKFPWMFKNIL